ncbi:MAG: cytochrome P450 [Pseudomonadota bacterium]
MAGTPSFHDYRTKPQIGRDVENRLLTHFFDRGALRRLPPDERLSGVRRLLLGMQHGQVPAPPWLKIPPATLKKLLPTLISLAPDANELDLDDHDLSFYQSLTNGASGFWATIDDADTLVLTDPIEVAKTLGASPDAYGPSSQQQEGMSAFQPQAVAMTLPGQDFERRRVINTDVLATDQRVHRLTADFLANTEEAFGAIEHAGASGALNWAAIDDSALQITKLSVWGHRESPFPNDLDALMKAANLRPLLTKLRRSSHRQLIYAVLPFLPEPIRRRLTPSNDARDRFLRAMAEAVPNAPAESLAGELAKHPGFERDAVEAAGQMPHWMFAMRGTVAVHTAYALVLLAIEPELERNVVDALIAAGGPAALRDPDTFADRRLDLLEKVIFEAGRLYPAVPMITRNVALPPIAETRIMVLNALNHRLEKFSGRAPHASNPWRWRSRDSSELPTIASTGVALPLFGGGRKACPGRNIALVLTKALIGHVLLRFALRSVHNASHPHIARLDREKLPITYDQFGLSISVSAR